MLSSGPDAAWGERLRLPPAIKSQSWNQRDHPDAPRDHSRERNRDRNRSPEGRLRDIGPDSDRLRPGDRPGQDRGPSRPRRGIIII